MNSPIRTYSLEKHFRSTPVLNGLDLDVPEASIFGLVGPNGVGKTTTIKLLMNIHVPDGGRAEVLGVDSRRLSADQLAQIGYVSENQELPGWMTVDYFLDYSKGFYPAWDDDLCAQLVRQFDLPLKTKLRNLSRGTLMKAALAASLAPRPRLIILDEPFSGLDPLVRDEFIEGMLERAEGTTILISSHDLAEIESFATHIAFLDQGRAQIQEELTSLSDRFRQVEVTLASPLTATPAWPATWLTPETSPVVVRFVETQFDPERTPAEVRRLFPTVRDIGFQPMPLRSIFVALAKAARKAA